VKKHRWLDVNELKLISLDSQKTDTYPGRVLHLDQDLNVPVGLPCESVLAIILDFSIPHVDHLEPVPNIAFFIRFPNLKFLVLHQIGFDKNGVLTLSKITSLRFVYMHGCNAQEFGFEPFENFEICENIQTLYLNGCKFNDKCLDFSSKLRRLKIVGCSHYSGVGTLKCSNLKSLQVPNTVLIPKNLTLPEHLCLTLLNPGIVTLSHSESFNRWLLENPITSLKRLVLNCTCDHLYDNFHLNLSQFPNLEELHIIDFDHRNTLSYTLAEGIVSIVVKLTWNKRYFNEQYIEAEKFIIHPLSTEMHMPLPVPPFLLTIISEYPNLIFSFMDDESQLALAITCKLVYKYYNGSHYRAFILAPIYGED